MEKEHKQGKLIKSSLWGKGELRRVRNHLASVCFREGVADWVKGSKFGGYSWEWYGSLERSRVLSQVTSSFH